MFIYINFYKKYDRICKRSFVYSIMNFTDQDYYKNIVKYFQDYSELKMLSEINKSSNIFVKSETNFKSIVREKKISIIVIC